MKRLDELFNEIFFNSNNLLSIIDLDEDESMAGAWTTPSIPDFGKFLLVSKVCRDKKVKWVHYLELESGFLGLLCRGVLNDENELSMLKEIFEHALSEQTGGTVGFQPVKITYSAAYKAESLIN